MANMYYSLYKNVKINYILHIYIFFFHLFYLKWYKFVPLVLIGIRVSGQKPRRTKATQDKSHREQKPHRTKALGTKAT